MIGVLILAHGSRLNETEETMTAIKNETAKELPGVLIEEAYLQFREKTLDEGLLSLVEKGALDIKVVPYFLFEGVHIKEDIPEEIAAFTKLHPELTVTLGRTLGADRRLAAVLVDRIREIL